MIHEVPSKPAHAQILWFGRDAWEASIPIPCVEKLLQWSLNLSKDGDTQAVSRERPPMVFIYKDNQKLGGQAAPTWSGMETPRACGGRSWARNAPAARQGATSGTDPKLHRGPREPTGISLAFFWDDICGWEAAAVGIGWR